MEYRRHLDSRRLEAQGGNEHKIYGDYLLNFDDTEAVERSPYRHVIEGLRELGLTRIVICHPATESGEDDNNKWWVAGYKIFPGTEQMVADNLGGELNICASITEEGKRKLECSFGAGDYQQFDTEDANELIWGYLETIHKSLTNSWEGRNIPI